MRLTVRLFAVGLLPLIALVAVATTVSHAQDAPAEATAHRAVGQAAPGFRMDDTDGNEVRSDEYRTKRYVMVFLSTRSDACKRASARLLERLAAVENLHVIAAVCDADLTGADGPSPTVMARRFKERVIGRGGPRDRFHVCTATANVRRAWGERVEDGRGPLVTVPTIVVVDAEGKIESCLVGEPTAKELAGMIR